MRHRAMGLGSLLALLLLLVACPQLEQWKRGQIETSHSAAEGSRITAPVQPIELPRTVREVLPLDESFTTLSYSEATDGFRVELLSPLDAATTAAWVLGELQARGYSAEDNPSRIVEEAGLSLAHPQAKYQRLVVHVRLNTADQVTLSYEAHEE